MSIGLRRLLATLAVVSTLGVAACGSSTKTTASPASPSSQCSPGAGLTRTATTSKYVMVLDVAPAETMYTQSQVASQHLTSGEVMIGGQMTDMGGATTMPMSSGSTSTMMNTTTPSMSGPGASSMPASAMPAGETASAHMEVHICDRSTGQALQNAQPAITVVDHSGGGMTDQVPVAVMQGVGQGASDTHYGNNVNMPIGNGYTVTVKLNADTATFNFTRTA